MNTIRLLAFFLLLMYLYLQYVQCPMFNVAASSLVCGGAGEYLFSQVWFRNKLVRQYKTSTLRHPFCDGGGDNVLLIIKRYHTDLCDVTFNFSKTSRESKKFHQYQHSSSTNSTVLYLYLVVYLTLGAGHCI